MIPFFSALLVFFFVKAASADCLVNAFSKGWYSSDGIHYSWNENTLTGAVPDYYWSGQPYYTEFHSFFVFDLTSIHGNVTDVILNLEIEAYNSSDLYESITLYDVSTSTNYLLDDWLPCGSYPPPDGCLPPPPDYSYGQEIFNDLGTGITYGNALIFPSDVGTIISITLSQDARNDIQTGPIFAIGVVLDKIGSTTDDEYIRFSSISDEPRVHQLQVILDTVLDTDSDGIDDACDSCPNDFGNDIDEDGICGDKDNCPALPNPSQLNSTPNPLPEDPGDACDSKDADNDGISDKDETKCGSDPADPSSKCVKMFPWLMLLLD
jgi:hypothetical protein